MQNKTDVSKRRMNKGNNLSEDVRHLNRPLQKIKKKKKGMIDKYNAHVAHVSFQIFCVSLSSYIYNTGN